MLKWSASIAILSASLMAGTALAQKSDTGLGGAWNFDGAYYVGIEGGGNWMASDTQLVDSSRFPTLTWNGKVGYDTGWDAGLHGGFAFANGFRLDEEFIFRYNTATHVSTYGAATGSMHDYAVITNAFYDIPVDFPVQPYVGIGIGMADYTPYHIKAPGFPTFVSGPGKGTVYQSYLGGPDSWGFAYQATVGVSYSFTDQISASLDYRYFERTGDYPPGIGNDYATHSIVAGLRYTFATVAPSPSPYVPPYVAPPPAPLPFALSYMVFFDFDKSDLTPDAKSIIDQAAKNAGTAKVTQITVTGHTDTVGSEAYNMRLSRRRAESVAAQLEKDGIPASEIELIAKGKHDLLVPTKDGVREPKNRRVTVVYAGMNS